MEDCIGGMMRRAILCDIDGTIALRGNRAPHDHDSSMEDAPNWPIIRLVDSLYAGKDVTLLLMSGRQEKYRPVTEYWLGAHGIFKYRSALIMRKTGDNRPDEIVKEELWSLHVKPDFDVRYVFDDRNKVVAMWRRLGLTCLQVAEGDF